MQTCIMVLTSLVLALPSSAGVIFVEKDGSGDFIDLQPAADAAADGDTIRIGPGRWAERHLFTILSENDSYTDSVVVGVNEKDLVFIGSGVGVTFIGPSVVIPFGALGPAGIVSGYDGDLVVMDMTIDHLNAGVYFGYGRLDVQDVEFRDCKIGIVTTADQGAHIRTCAFTNSVNIGIFGGWLGEYVSISDCVFSTERPNSTQQIVMLGTEDINIDNCDFYDSVTSIQFEGLNSSGLVTNCRIHGGYGAHIVVVSGATMEMRDCELWGGRYQLGLRSAGNFIGSGNTLHGADDQAGSYWAIDLGGCMLQLHDNHLFKGEGDYIIKCSPTVSQTTIVHDLTNNWWGTTERDSIAAWIYDIHDDPDIHTEILFEPFLTSPVANEKAKMGDLKRLFR